MVVALTRRSFLQTLGALPLAAARQAPLHGIFPIAQTPFTASNKLDVDALVSQVRFLDRCGVHGLVWPQLASEYASLSEPERLQGAEAILAAAKGLKPAVIIGVQSADLATSLRYARHADKLGADGVIAIPPKTEDQSALLDFYKQLGRATPLPLFIQTVGNFPVDLVLRLAGEVPTLRYVKDEAGSTLPRISEFRRRAPHLHIHTGGHGQTLLDEMLRGSAGSMPAASFADLYVPVWNLWQEDKRREAIDAFSRPLLLVIEAIQYGVESLKYILHLRGVFPHYGVRGPGGRAPLDEEGKLALRTLLEHLKPDLRA
jgi:4-hydroxy-tetrahydrodipicolinate synthase